jgi:hypothetical protein
VARAEGVQVEIVGMGNTRLSIGCRRIEGIHVCGRLRRILDLSYLLPLQADLESNAGFDGALWVQSTAFVDSGVLFNRNQVREGTSRLRRE